MGNGRFWRQWALFGGGFCFRRGIFLRNRDGEKIVTGVAAPLYPFSNLVLSFRKFRRPAEDFLDLLFPRSCVECGEPVEESPYRFICSSCSRQLTVVRQPACSTCGFPFFGLLAGDRVCPHCEELDPLFREARTAVLFKGPAKKIVHEVKYKGQIHLVNDMGRMIARSEDILDFARGGILVPVPLHSRKERERGFNQSLLIAEEIATLTRGKARVWDGLARIRDTVSQTQFDRKRRQRNLKNAFALRKDCTFNPSLRFILVDDVFTTGSTLNACAAVLRRGGIHRIDVITFGHG